MAFTRLLSITHDLDAHLRQIHPKPGCDLCKDGLVGFQANYHRVTGEGISLEEEALFLNMTKAKMCPQPKETLFYPALLMLGNGEFGIPTFGFEQSELGNSQLVSVKMGNFNFIRQ